MPIWSQLKAFKSRIFSMKRRLVKLQKLCFVAYGGNPSKAELFAFTDPTDPFTTIQRCKDLIKQMLKERTSMLSHYHHGKIGSTPNFQHDITGSAWDTKIINAQLVQALDEAEANYNKTPTTTKRKREASTPSTSGSSPAPSPKRIQVDPQSPETSKKKKKDKKKKKNKKNKKKKMMRAGTEVK